MKDRNAAGKANPENGVGIAVGLGAGVAIGAGLGAAFDNMALWVGAGLAIGVALSFVFNTARRRGNGAGDQG